MTNKIKFTGAVTPSKEYFGESVQDKDILHTFVVNDSREVEVYEDASGKMTVIEDGYECEDLTLEELFFSKVETEDEYRLSCETCDCDDDDVKVREDYVVTMCDSCFKNYKENVLGESSK